MLSAIATLVLMTLMVIFPLLIPIGVTAVAFVSKRRQREKPAPTPRLRITHGFQQLVSSN